MFKFNKKKEFFYLLTTVILSSSIYATNVTDDQETKITFEHINSFEKYSILKDEIKETAYNPPLNQSENEVIATLFSHINFCDNGNEEQQSFFREYADSLQEYPVQGTWVIRKEGNFIGELTLEDENHHYGRLPSFSTINTAILERETKLGAGTKVRRFVYDQILPYVGKEVKSIRYSYSTNSIIRENYVFSGVESNVFPYDNFASIISQVRSGSSVSNYCDEGISFFYPPLESHSLISDYPRIEELRNITFELENSDTRLKAKEKFYEFFNSLK